MKTIGMLGGMSWESTADYYRILNTETSRRLGGLHSARILLHSCDFHDLEERLRAGDWPGISRSLCTAARTVETAGADLLLLCTNTMHRVAEDIETATTIPLVHIVDAAAAGIKALGVRTVGLLGTAFTMEQPFYRERLERRHGIEVLVPDAADRRLVHEVIFGELCKGMVREESRREYARIAEALAGRGAGAVLLGCTEIAMLLREGDAPVPLLDTTRVHALAGLDLALAD